MTSLRMAVRAHPTIAYLVLLFGGAWVLFLPALLGQSGIGLLAVDIPREPGLLLAVLAIMGGGSILVTWIADGGAAAKAFARRAIALRAGPQWYLLAIFGVPVLVLVATVILRGPDALAPVAQNLAELPGGYLLPLIIAAVLINICEEMAWLSFLTDRWQERIGPLRASLAVAPLFGLLHIPLFFIVGGLADGRLPLSAFPEYAVLLLVVATVPVRILLTWVWNSTHKSLPLAAIFHQSIDLTAGAFMLATFYPGINGLWVYAALAVAALVVAVATRGRLGLPSRAGAAGAALAGAPVVVKV